MNEEKKIQLQVFLKIGVVVGFAFLYAWAGMEHKWLRRFIAPSWLGLWMWYFSKDKWCLIQVPIQMVTLSMGYGGDALGEKIMRRLTFGLANGYSTNAYTGLCILKKLRANFNSKKLLWFIWHPMLVTTSYIALGVWNFAGYARVEETLLGLIVGLSIMRVNRGSE